jgi:predicted RNA-binding Zn-ribbon protein involved in translation (DUF1610 family)
MRRLAIGTVPIVEGTDFSPEDCDKCDGNGIIKCKPTSNQRKRYNCDQVGLLRNEKLQADNRRKLVKNLPVVNKNIMNKSSTQMIVNQTVVDFIGFSLHNRQ